MLVLVLVVLEMWSDDVLQPNLSKLHQFLAFLKIFLDKFGSFHPASQLSPRGIYLGGCVWHICYSGATTCLASGRKLSVPSQNNPNGGMDLLGFKMKIFLSTLPPPQTLSHTYLTVHDKYAKRVKFKPTEQAENLLLCLKENLFGN